MVKMTASLEQNVGQDYLEYNEMPNINLWYQYVVNACNAPNVGYSQQNRNKKTVNGITYYDCSSLMWYGATAGGFDAETAYLQACGSAYSGNAITTTFERAWLQAMGFTQMPINGEWLAGDILWRKGHTEMVHTGGTGTGITMGAHTSQVSLARQVSINGYYSTASEWTSLWRYTGSTLLNWVNDNRALTDAEKENNATIIYSVLYSYGWSYNAICAVIGNMEIESYLSPGVWQNFTINYNHGFGLVQWTPATNYTNWATANGYNIDDGYGQLDWLENETVPFGQWIGTPHNMSFSEFKTSNLSVAQLTEIFVDCFERPSSPDYNARITCAEKWAEYLLYVNPVNPNGSTQRKNMPVWMMLRRF